jgi:hypothetical protein
MADEYQVTYEYSAGNSITFKTDDLNIEYINPGYHEDVRVDGIIVVTDPGYSYKRFTFTAILEGATMDTFDTVLTGAIDHTGAYPRITKIYWNGATTETNIEVGRPKVRTIDRSAGWWHVAVTLGEKDQ